MMMSVQISRYGSVGSSAARIAPNAVNIHLRISLMFIIEMGFDEQIEFYAKVNILSTQPSITKNFKIKNKPKYQCIRHL